MSDQARNLRRLAGSPDQPLPLPQLPALAITGGKGGVGKTCISVNLSVLLAKIGIKPLLVDLDMGLANADVLLGVNPQTSLFEVVIGGRPLREALIETPQGIGFVPAASGREELTRLSHSQFALLFRQLEIAARDYNLLILDTMAGISAEVINFLRASAVILCVLTPDPTSMTDAYALIKVLEQQHPGKDIRIVVNQAGSDDEAMQTFARLRKVVQSYLGRELGYIGHLPRDMHVVEAVRKRSPFITNPELPASRALKAIAMRLKGINWRG